MERCPVCDGRGKLQGFYPDRPADEWVDCRACWGTGIVANPAIRSVPVPYPEPYPVPYPQPYPVPVRPDPWRYRWIPQPIVWGTVVSSGTAADTGITVTYALND